MVWCNNCAKHVHGIRPFDGGLACDFCGRILENFNFSTEVTFFKNAAGQGIASSDDAETREAALHGLLELAIEKNNGSGCNNIKNI